MPHLSRFPLILLAIGGGVASLAEAQVARPPRTKPTVIVGPASLAAVSPATAQVTLTWPAVASAERYRLTRIANTGDAEVTVAELPASSFVFEGANCVTTSGLPNCVFVDVTKKRPNDRRPIRGEEPIYPHAVSSGALYTYRVWAILPGPVVTPPSPPATVRVL